MNPIIPIKQWDESLEEQLPICDFEEQEQIIGRAITQLPPSVSHDDALLFGAMLSNIMNAPIAQAQVPLYKPNEIFFIRDLGQSTGRSLHL